MRFAWLNILVAFASILWTPYAGAVTAGPYFPLVDGNTWTYRVDNSASPNETWTVQPGTFLVNGASTKKISFAPSGITRNFTNDASGIRQHGVFAPSVNYGSPCFLQAETDVISPP